VGSLEKVESLNSIARHFGRRPDFVSKLRCAATPGKIPGVLGMQNVLNGVSMAGLRYNEGSMIRFTLNGNNYEFAGADDAPLLWVIRDSAELTGTKYGCGIGQCGPYSRIRKAIHRASELSRKGPEDE
jgi:hypothetical protein